MDRRHFLTTIGTAGVLASTGVTLASTPGVYDPTEKSVAELAHAMANGQTTARDLVIAYRARIERFDRGVEGLHSVIAVNPMAEHDAIALDEERRAGRVRGPLHGIPLLLKDNIETKDPMPTTAGSHAFARSTHAQDADLVARLRAAGAVILGKANLSEWANFRCNQSSSGWSGIGGQTGNAYDRHRNPSGSSSGSGAAAAASFCAVAVGSETDGSILSPAANNGLVGLKPTIGMVSGRGVVPLSPRQDTAGPMGRSVADVALLAEVMSERPLSSDGGAFQLNAFTLSGVRVGVMPLDASAHPKTAALRTHALAALKAQGAVLVDLVNPAGFEAMGLPEWEALQFEFKDAINRYLAGLDPAKVPARTLSDLIAFNRAHADIEMPFFGQDIFESSDAKGPLTDPAYLEARATLDRCADREGLAALFATPVDVLFATGGGPASLIDHVWGDRGAGGGGAPIASAAAIAGYPSLTVPGGYIEGLPMGLTLVAPRFKDGQLLQIGAALERLLPARVPPRLV
jgi:amidase